MWFLNSVFMRFTFLSVVKANFGAIVSLRFPLITSPLLYFGQSGRYPKTPKGIN